MKKIYLISALFALSTSNIYAQWDTITSFSSYVSDLKTFDGNLYIGGNFMGSQGDTCFWSAYFDGLTLIRHTTLIGGSGIRAFDVFENELYSVDALHHSFALGVSKWDGNTWLDAGSTNYSHSTIYADNGDLYVVSDNGLIRVKSAGGSFQTFYDFAGNGSITSIIRYNNQLIFAGSFTDINGVPFDNVAQWDGTTWSALGSGISSGTSCMAILNNELYVAGIDEAGGQSIDELAKWDGTTWTDAGAGLTGFDEINDMVTYYNVLFIAGRFDVIGTVTTHDVAKWDGSAWGGLNLAHYDHSITSIEAYNNEIYVGSFDFGAGHLFRYKGSVGVEKILEVNSFELYPNPTKEVLNIKADIIGTHNVSVEVVDILGNVLVYNTYELNGILTTSIDCSGLAQGTYILVISDEDSAMVIKREKFVVQ